MYNMVNNNPNVAIYNSMTIEDLQKEGNKPDLLAEDKTLILHAIASKRATNSGVTSTSNTDTAKAVTPASKK